MINFLTRFACKEEKTKMEKYLGILFLQSYLLVF